MAPWTAVACLLLSSCAVLMLSALRPEEDDEVNSDDEHEIPPIVLSMGIGCLVGAAQFGLRAHGVQKDRSELTRKLEQDIQNYLDDINTWMTTKEHLKFSEAAELQYKIEYEVLEDLLKCTRSDKEWVHSELLLDFLPPNLPYFMNTEVFRTWSKDFHGMSGATPSNLELASDLCRVNTMEASVQAQVKALNNGLQNDGSYRVSANLSKQICAAVEFAKEEALEPRRSGAEKKVVAAGAVAAGAVATGATILLSVKPQILALHGLKAAGIAAVQASTHNGVAQAATLLGGEAPVILGMENAALQAGAVGMGGALFGSVANAACKMALKNTFKHSGGLNDDETAAAGEARSLDMCCSGWCPCGESGNQCNCREGDTVRYGIIGDWQYRTVRREESGNVTCNAADFNRRKPLNEKGRGFGCECLRKELAQTLSALEAQSAIVQDDWVKCANLGKSCKCLPNGNIPAEIRFGTPRSWANMSAPTEGSFTCSPETFSGFGGEAVARVDPNKNRCECKGILRASSRKDGKFTKLEGFTCGGADYSAPESNSRGQCQKMCREDDSCVGFDFKNRACRHWKQLSPSESSDHDCDHKQGAISYKKVLIGVGPAQGRERCVDVHERLTCHREAGNKPRRIFTSIRSAANALFDISTISEGDRHQVCARRRDKDESWGMDLMIQCI